MTAAISLHCSGVGSVPVGLCAQAWRTKMENSGAFCREGSPINSAMSRKVGRWGRAGVRGIHVPDCRYTQRPSSGLERCLRLTSQGIHGLSPVPTQTTGHLWFQGLITTYLQVIQETFQVKSSLCCIPIVIGPNVFKSSRGKYTIMILCKQMGESFSVFSSSRRQGWKIQVSVQTEYQQRNGGSEGL